MKRVDKSKFRKLSVEEREIVDNRRFRHIRRLAKIEATGFNGRDESLRMHWCILESHKPVKLVPVYWGEVRISYGPRPGGYPSKHLMLPIEMQLVGLGLRDDPVYELTDNCRSWAGVILDLVWCINHH